VRERFWLSHPRDKGIQADLHPEGVQEGRHSLHLRHGGKFRSCGSRRSYLKSHRRRRWFSLSELLNSHETALLFSLGRVSEKLEEFYWSPIMKDHRHSDSPGG
jgi:hypothetical protein